MGEGLYWATTSLVGQLGADIAAVFLFLAGLPLLTGASIASVLRATGRGLADTTRTLARSSAELRPQRPQVTTGGARRAPLRPPEPSASELVVHATPRRGAVVGWL